MKRLLWLIPVALAGCATPMREGPQGGAYPVLTREEITLVVEDLKLGAGDPCDRKSVVVVHYHGTMENDKVFDSTRGKDPIEFPLDRLITGWQVGIPGMKAGGIRRLYVPSRMAYGEKGTGPIPPNTDLVFVVELMEIKTKDPTPPAKGEPAKTPTPPPPTPPTTPPPPRPGGG